MRQRRKPSLPGAAVSSSKAASHHQGVSSLGPKDLQYLKMLEIQNNEARRDGISDIISDGALGEKSYICKKCSDMQVDGYFHSTNSK